MLYRLSYVSGKCPAPCAVFFNGAGDGNRTRTSSLEGYSSTIELLPPGGVTCFQICRLGRHSREELYNSGAGQAGIQFLALSISWWREVDYSGHPALRPSGASLSAVQIRSWRICRTCILFSVALIHLQLTLLRK